MPHTNPGSRMIHLLDFSDSVRILSTLYSRFILQTFTVIYSLPAINRMTVKNYGEYFSIESPQIIIAVVGFFI
jgi:hypothetical protein